jgi:hypothetical protein
MFEKVIRPTISELWRGIQEAKRKFPVGTEWRHVSSGDVYEIVSHGVDEETGEAEVGYCRAAPLADSRVPLPRCSIGDFPTDYAREVIFHRLLSKMATPDRFQRVYRTECFESVGGKVLTSV